MLPGAWLESTAGSEVVRVRQRFRNTVEFFYGLESLAPRPTPNLEHQVLIFV